MNIIFCGDRNVVRPIAVGVSTLVRHSRVPSELRITLLTYGWSSHDITVIRRAAESAHVEQIECSRHRLPDVSSGRHVTPAAYLMLMIPELLDDRLERAIYLDSDLLVRTDIRPLYDTDLQGLTTAGTRAGSRPFIGSPGTYPAWRQLGLDPAAPVVNTGVLVLDLDKWRRQQIGQRALRFAESMGRRMRWADQGALNAVLQGEWAPIHHKWNATSGVFEDDKGLFAVEHRHVIEEARSDPAIVHFTGPAKPWMHHVERDYVDEWRRASSAIGWTPWLERRSTKVVLSRIKKRIHHRLQAGE